MGTCSIRLCRCGHAKKSHSHWMVLFAVVNSQSTFRLLSETLAVKMHQSPNYVLAAAANTFISNVCVALHSFRQWRRWLMSYVVDGCRALEKAKENTETMAQRRREILLRLFAWSVGVRCPTEINSPNIWTAITRSVPASAAAVAAPATSVYI